MDLPQIAIQICTYNRYNEIRKTVEALQKYLIYPKEKITLYICDDSSPGGYTQKLSRLNLFKYWTTHMVVTPSNVGWGGNVNHGLANIPEEIIFFIEDDYVLTKELDLRIGVLLLLEKSHIGMLRYRGTTGTRLVYHQFEANISRWANVFSSAWYEGAPTVPYTFSYLHFDGNSPDIWLYSNGPHLKSKSFHDFYGPYPEGLKLGHTEESFAHLVKDKMRADPTHAPAIVILPEWIPMWFNHIGKSYQFTKEDIGG